MVDIHSHILPGLDDGAKTIDDSVAMLKVAAESGTTDIVATPHSDMHYQFQPELIEEKIKELQSLAGNSIRIHRGCDFHLHFDNIQDCLAHPTKYTINHKNYLLVEFSDQLIAPTSGEIFNRLSNVGITPIITHPERNALLSKKLDLLARWIQEGALVQVTAQSFLGRFGKHAISTSEELMDKGMVHFIASDAHDTEYRPPILRDAYKHIEHKYGADRAEALFTINPRATLTGEYLEFFDVAEVKPRKWYQFW
ncbi:MAG: exopolysaccharide biosynthesis protein [Acidobacteriota bacterium]|nr:exopolysaccharide biosynthesis protein [Acidobacteriota bacterium]